MIMDSELDEQRVIFSDNLTRYIKKSGKTQREVAKDLNINAQTLNTWVRGIALPRMGKVQALADYFNISKSDLLERPGKRNVVTEVSRIPVLGSVPCGIPLNAIQNIEDWEEVPAAENQDGELYALRAKGDSMSPQIKDGDTLIFHRQPDAESSEIVIVMVNHDDATCKQLRKTESGITLIPLNPAFEPLVFSWKDIVQLPVTIIGKVVEIRRKL